MIQLRLSVFGLLALLTVTACGGSGSGTSADSDSRDPALFGSGENFVNFESGQVRPLALSGDASRLFVTNTPNATLDIFKADDDGLQLQQRVPVGLEPVAVAVRNDAEAWVVNHLSDSISVVDISQKPARVVKTLFTGDEPRDIVFAGSDRSLAFVTAARRGQNGPNDQPIDAALTTPGVSRADVWVFDAAATGDSVGGDPLAVVSMFGDTPRALAASADGSRVYVAVMNSGNQTTAIGENGIAKSGPVQSSDGAIQPDTGLIVQFDGQRWRDETGAATDLNDTSYDSLVPFSLPDYDVFVLAANRSPAVMERISGVGTTLFNMIENPATGVLYVSNTEALNLNRFEGPGVAAASLSGNFIRNRITLIDDSAVSARDLNPHLDHTMAQASEQARELSIAQPLGMAISQNGQSLYVAGFGSGKVAIYDSSALADGSFAVDADGQIKLSSGGPTGLVLDESRERLYVLARFENKISIIDTGTHSEIDAVQLFNPEPARVIEGRKFLYDASQMSSHGDASCASCHVFADNDALAWDLGNPDIPVVANPNQFVNRFLAPDEAAVFHPMKGPMGTQSLRGLVDAGPMHWRGDRTGQSASANESLEMAAFKEFNGAFVDLLGRSEELTPAQMQQIAEFGLTLNYPPNPIRALDNGLTESQQAGRDIYMNKPTTGEVFRCNDCHTLDPANGHFGTSGQSSVEGDDISQEFKVPHLRNMYQKVGKFGSSGRFSATDEDFGAQIRGFGFMHDGAMDTLDSFFRGEVFRFDTDPQRNAEQREQVVDFVMAFDSNMAPIVGQQATLSAETLADTDTRIDLLIDRADADECDLVARGVVQNEARGYLYQGGATFESDRGETVSYQQLRMAARDVDGAITFTCVPPGSGVWLGIDRNQDGVPDGQSPSF